MLRRGHHTEDTLNVFFFCLNAKQKGNFYAHPNFIHTAPPRSREHLRTTDEADCLVTGRVKSSGLS